MIVETEDKNVLVSLDGEPMEMKSPLHFSVQLKLARIEDGAGGVSVILHASDLHFGKADPAVVEAFYQEIERQKPDLVILSGDSHNRQQEEFRLAQDFIARITAPVFTVPATTTFRALTPGCALPTYGPLHGTISVPCRTPCMKTIPCFVVGITRRGRSCRTGTGPTA